MKNLSKAALLAMLMAGTTVTLGLTVASPALAQKKAKGDAAAAAAGPKFTVNENVRKGQDAALAEMRKVGPILAASGGKVTAANKAQVVATLQAAEPGVAAAEAAAVTNDEQYVATELRYRLQSLLLVTQYADDAAGQRAAGAALVPTLDKLLANPVTPQSNVADYAMERGRIAFQQNQFRPALAYFERARAAGNTESLNDAFIIDTKVKLGDYAGAATDSEQAMARLKAAGQPVPESFYLIGIENAYRAKNPELAARYELRRYADFPVAKNFHDALIRLQSRSAPLDLRQRLDVWRLMRASGTLADQKERVLYANDALEAGASREAQAVLEEFRAGKPMTALDPDVRTLLTSANTRVAAATPLAKAEADARSGDAQAALTAANFHYQAGQYAKAAELYKLAQTRGAPDKDALLISLGAAQAQSGDKAGAQASFQAVTSSPRKEIAAYWLAWLARAA